MNEFKQISDIADKHNISPQSLGKILSKYKIQKKRIYNRNTKRTQLYVEYTQLLIDKIQEWQQERSEIVTIDFTLKKKEKCLDKIYKTICFKG